MTLSAKINETIYYSTKITDEFGKTNTAICLGCGEELIYHRNIAKVKIQHWVHKVPCNFETEPETESHLYLKEYVYNNLSSEYTKHYPDSVFVGNQKPDIFIETSLGLKIAVEVQCSPITYEKFMERTKGYMLKGIFVFWVFGKKWQKESYGEKRINEVERKLHQLNYGRLYYAIHLATNIGKCYIRPIHLETIIREKDYCANCWWEENISNWNGDCSRCWVYANDLDGSVVQNPLKSTKKVIGTDETFSENLKFICFQNEGYMLARLTDNTFWSEKK